MRRVEVAEALDEARGEEGRLRARYAASRSSSGFTASYAPSWRAWATDSSDEPW